MAIAWVLRQGEDVVPIPGTRRAKYLEENLKSSSIKLSDTEFEKLCKIADPTSVYGDRYDEAFMKVSERGQDDEGTGNGSSEATSHHSRCPPADDIQGLL